MHGLTTAAVTGLLAVLCFVVPTAAPTSSEVVYFVSGEVLPIAQHRIEDGEVVLELRGVGEVRWDPALIARIELDRSPRRGPDRPVELESIVAEERSGRMLARPYGALIQQASEAHGVNLYLLHALIEVESQYKGSAESRIGAMGLMQLMPALAAEYAVHDPFDPPSNIDAGTRHLRTLIDRYGIADALAAYNAGEGSVRRFDGIPPFPETYNYVNRIMDLVDANQSD